MIQRFGKENPTVSHLSLTFPFTVFGAKLIYQTYHRSTQDYCYLHHLHKASPPLHHCYQKPQPSHHQFEPPLRVLFAICECYFLSFFWWYGVHSYVRGMEYTLRVHNNFLAYVRLFFIIKNYFNY